MTTKAKIKSPIEGAKERRDEIAASRDQVREFKAGELAKVAKIDGDRAAGKLGTDFTGRSTAVANVTDAEDQERYLVELLEVAEQNFASWSLIEDIGDPHAQREALEVKRAATVEGIRSLLAEYAEAVAAYNSTLTGHIGTARKAGLVEGEADPTLPVLSGGGAHGHPRRLVIEGEHFVTLTADIDKIIKEATR